MMIPSCVRFSISDPVWQKVYDAAEKKAASNVRLCQNRPVLIEGGGYNGLWLETQPMGGDMYAARNPEVALNNQLFFMENIRPDGRLPSVITFDEASDQPLNLMSAASDVYKRQLSGILLPASCAQPV